MLIMIIVSIDSNFDVRILIVSPFSQESSRNLLNLYLIQSSSSTRGLEIIILLFYHSIKNNIHLSKKSIR